MRNLFYLCVFIFITSCYQEVILPPTYISDVNTLTFALSDSQITKIHSSRNTRIEIYPTPIMEINNSSFALKRFSIRGESTLAFKRKSYSVNMKNSFLYTGSNESIIIDKFKLLSMVYDFTYIENYLGSELMRKVNLWPLESFYTEIIFNDKSEGLYYFVEAPDNFCFTNNTYQGLVRRGYQNAISTVESTSSLNTNDLSERFHTIYSLIKSYSGEELYLELGKLIDLKQYFRFMAVNYLISNGDYTDEVYFYLSYTDGEMGKFNVMAWDLDDLFVNKPHEVGRNWAIGNVFGNRIYSSQNDIVADIGNRLIFSIEDDLDYIIAKDEYLYKHYLIELTNVLNLIDIAFVNDLFNELEEQILPFYANENIILQSQYDVNATSLDDLLLNISETKTRLIERIHETNNQVKWYR